ncbi:hypothetical protein [Aquimarina litoralis]|uniref:hypothetical protein n=1 Tax=Aquimarina litoralis TaxID=584605 RepID=UPI001C585A6B|nr:hypothetical protein [Aquimarina litoralis]MBW1296460.1 hypothetical protein [Aquimarina litoralis]
MKEEKLKEMISKSTIETSDDFINKVMKGIELQEERKKQSIFWSFPVILFVCSALILAIVGLLFYMLNIQNFMEYATFNSIPKTPVFLLVIGVAFYYINHIMRLHHNEKTI